MDKKRLAKLIGTEELTVTETMERIDAGEKGILFIVDGEGRLVGCVSDGDIRRWILKTGDLMASVSNVMMTTPRALFIKEKKRAKRLMKREAINALPLLDAAYRIVDIVLLSDIRETDALIEKGDLSEVPLVIMAGGKGSRLYPYTKILPKPLIPIGDTPIIERIINSFVEYGVKKIYITVNYKKGMIKSYFSDLSPNYKIQYVEEDKPLGTGGSLKLIEDKFETPIIVSNCDSLIRVDYSDVYDYHIKLGNQITVVSALKNIVVPYGVMKSGENGEIIKIEEKPKNSYFINTGLYVINPDAIENIPEGVAFHMTHLVETIMKAGGRVGMYPVSEDAFLDMGEFSEMQRMEEKLNIAMEK